MSEIIDGHKTHKLTLMGRVRGYFLAGIVVTAPIAITVYLTFVFFTFIDEKVSNILPNSVYFLIYGDGYFPGLGILIALVFFVVIGWFATNFLGRFFIRFSESILDRMPVVRTVYSAIKQIFETVMASKSQAFRECVLIEYPRKGIWSIGFLTGVTQGEVQNLTDDEVLNVFLPTTPNPTSGFLLFVPRKDVYFLGMSVEEGIKMIMSAGILTPTEGMIKKEADKKVIRRKKKST